MANRVRGTNGNFDINTEGDAWLLKPLGIKANIIATIFGGDGGTVQLTSLELTLSTLVWNQSGPPDDNFAYLGDAHITTNLPFPLVSNCPAGWRDDGSWETGTVKFTPAPGSDGLLQLTEGLIEAGPTLVAKPGCGQFNALYWCHFYLLPLGLSHPIPHWTPTGMVTSPPDICMQTAIMRGLYGTHEIGSMHATKTFIRGAIP